MPRSSVFQWFTYGRENANDDERSGRPRASSHTLKKCAKSFRKIDDSAYVIQLNIVRIIFHLLQYTFRLSFDSSCLRRLANRHARIRTSQRKTRRREGRRKLM